MEIIQYLDDGGKPLRDLPLSNEELLAGYRALRRARHFDERALVLQRQGRLGVYPPFKGQEAAQVGVALCLKADHDWLLPSYRESAAALTFGMPISKLILSWRADPAGWGAPAHVNMVQFYIPIATQIPQAAGVAHAQRLLGKDAVAAVFIGDGGTSEGDFHEGLNFAGVFDTPNVFFCNNNQWAISVPRERQTASETLAQKATACGFDGEQVDGNDVIAVCERVEAALLRARQGKGATLIECLSYRLGDHTTADDASRYRSEEEVRRAWREEPVSRLRSLLVARGDWDEGREQALIAELQGLLQQAVERFEATAPRPPQALFEHVYAQWPQALAEQRESFQQRLLRQAAAGGGA